MHGWFGADATGVVCGAHDIHREGTKDHIQVMINMGTTSNPKAIQGPKHLAPYIG